MKIAVPCLYAEYGRYINRFRSIPFEIDVLKPVERRILVSLYQQATRTKFQKSAKVVGDVIGRFHPHGDTSAYDSLVNIVQKGLAIGQGNWGSKIGIGEDPAAAMRYTEVKSNPALHSLFEECLNFVPWKDLELDEEPLYLPSPIPIGLIGSDIITGISFYTTKIPQYSLPDLIKRMRYLLGDDDISETDAIIKPNIEGCNLSGQFKEILELGEGELTVQPKVQNFKTHLEIYGKCPIYGFNKLIKESEMLNISIIDNSKSTYGTKIIVEPIKQRIIDNHLWNVIINLISFKIKIRVNVVNDLGSVSTKSIDSLLKQNYNCWKEANINKYNFDISKLKDKKFDLEILLIIRKILQDNPGVKTIDQICQIYSSNKNNKIDVGIIRSVCSKYTIKSLIESHIDISAITKQINKLNDELSNIDAILFDKLSSI